MHSSLQPTRRTTGSAILGVLLAMLGFLGPQSLGAQSDSSRTPKPTLFPEPSSGTNVDLSNPLQKTWKYNAAKNRYEAYSEIGALSYPTGESLNVTEYFQMLSKDKQGDYFRQKTQSNAYALGGNDRGSISDYVRAELNNPTISKVFGEGGVDFQLNGSAMVKLGGNINENRNPSNSKRQQKYFVPMFDQQIQISANGNIGEFVKLGINYDTEAAFEFDNQQNLGWKGKPDGILKDVQVGNVSLNLPTQLIKPANNLFGVSTTMQFGKTKVTTVFSQNKGQSTETVLKGGAQLNEFKISADNYDQNRHFFLASFFRENYDQWLENLPIVASGVVINRVEVWVTNRNANVETPRDIMAYMDLGDANPYRSSLNGTGTGAADNAANNLYAQIQNDDLARQSPTAIDRLYSLFPNFEQTVDFDLLNYARQLNEKEFALNTQLGYISLTQPLNNDEILAVAFEYTYNGNTYQVGEFSRDVAPGDQKVLHLKMLKGNTIRTRLPMWDLMMKNIYALNTYQLSLEDFKLNLIYADDTSGADYNYLPVTVDLPELKGGNPLLRVVGLDKLNRQQEAKPDGVFDAIEGITINTQYARIIFPVVEPFGESLREKFDAYTDLADYYCFNALYDSTKWLAQQDVKHNKFFLTGSFKSANGAELYLGTTNLQRGSVRVTANGRPLQEGLDYEVDYALGRVRITNQGLLQGGAEIRASADGQSFFNIQQKTLLGGRIEHQVNKHLLLGATALHMYERPLQTKTNFNEEPLLNSILGADLAYSSQSRYITKLVDKLPFLETKEVSNVTAYLELAKIFPHNHKSQGGQRGISNLEDFENAELANDFKGVGNWTVASIPQKQPELFPDVQLSDKRFWLQHHASLSFYTTDPLFYRDFDMPDNFKNRVDEILSDPYQRQVDQREVFPQRQFPQGTPTILPTLDLYYQPGVRGLYNFNSDPNEINAQGELLNKKMSWAGIMRRVDQNDFEAANIDYIEIWMMDPLMDKPTLSGDLYLHLGSISEDILPDRRKAFENGLSAQGSYNEVDSSLFGLVPTGPQINFAFDNNPASIKAQDVGLDGLNDQQERTYLDSVYLQALATNFGTGAPIYQQAFNDPSGDNFTHYLEESYTTSDADILGRYSRYQGMEGNSNPDKYTSGRYAEMPKSSTPIPNGEDINRDFTMNQSEDYFQYRIKINTNDLRIGSNYVADIVSNTVTLRNGKDREIRWIQFKIPIREFEKSVGNISDFKSIRFMRLVATGFEDDVVMRIGYLNMVRADWRRYTNSLKTPGVVVPTDPNDGTKFVVSTVNLEENGKRSPVAYVLPPGIVRVQNMASLGMVQENEQSLSVQVCDLKPGDARAAFKTSEFDVRNYKRLQLYVHAEEAIQNTINDGEVSAFIRFGTDLSNNYYEYEIPLKMTRGFVNTNLANAESLVWPEENFIDIALQEFYNLKIERQNSGWPMTAPFVRPSTRGKISVIGLPDVGNVRVVMVGVKNNGSKLNCFEVWFNELRVKDIANQGGWAALGSMQTQLADFGQLSVGGTIRTIGFGDVDKKLNDRSLNHTYNYDIASNLELGKFFPAKSGVSIPMFIGWSENVVRPKFYPLNPDLELQTFLNGIANQAQRDQILKAAQEYNSLYSLNFANVRLASSMGQKAKLYSPSNFSVGYSFQRNYRSNQQIEEYFLETSQATLGYAYSTNTSFIRPFKKIKGKRLGFVRDFNFNFKPSTLSTNWQVNRLYSEQQARNNNNFRQINPRMFDKNFTMNRMYNVSIPLATSLNLSYTATANARIQEPYGRLDSELKRDSVLQEFLNLGRMSRFYQNTNLSYTLPFAKFKKLNWISGSVTYQGSYEWNQAPPAFASMGARIQNSQDINLSSQLNFTQLYSKFKWLREYNKPKTVKNPPKEEGEDPDGASAIQTGSTSTVPPNPAVVMVGNFITMFKNASMNYQRREGSELPGFAYKPDYFGQNFKHIQPGLGYVFGLQDPNLRYRMAGEGALLNDTRQPNFYRNNLTESFTGSVTIEPLKDFRIRLDIVRNQTNGIQSLFKWDGFDWVDQGLTQNGTYNVSGWFFPTHFTKNLNAGPGNYPNPIFKQFEDNRYTVAQRLSLQDPRVGAIATDTITKFPLGYSRSSQDVIIGSFYASYSGLDPSLADISGFPKIPLPNWNINYTGLTKIKAIGEKFSNITLKHAYNGKYTIGQFSQNLRYSAGEAAAMGIDFTPQFQIADVTISEGFFPLAGVNITTKKGWTLGMEYKRSRVLKLFAASFNLTEMRSNEFQLTGGYRVTGLTLPFRRNGRKIYLPNDFRFDLSVAVQDNSTMIRKIDMDINKYSAGMKNIRIAPSVTYQVNDKVNFALRYNRVVMDPKMATQFYTALTEFGIELRYQFN